MMPLNHYPNPVIARGAIFLDRDGTLNCKAPEGEYIRRPQDLELIQGAARAVLRINRAGIPAILVTNQRWLSTVSAGDAAYPAIESRLGELLGAAGAKLDASYTCPHPLDSCDCRKPAPGLLLRGAVALGIDLGASVMIGDSIADIYAGLAAGTATVLVDPADGGIAASVPGCFVAGDITAAAHWAIGRVREPTCESS
jgi:D-glycero-D-manno-heptose 1,7-bisphosphate phosphatase